MQTSQPRSDGAMRVLRDRYELLAVLGRSASGTVYRAVDRRRTHLTEAARSVAVKVLNADYTAQPEALAELEREFHQAQSLSHPNIASVFDLDRDGDTYFIVMDLLDGETLASILRKLVGRPMRREHAFAIVNGVGAALAYAHGRDIVHGDLKPDAVMLTRSGDVRVLDFGFARNRALDLHTASALHEPSPPSPAYASVERVNGSEPDVSDDVYSFACLAYELFTGQHPFGGRSALLARAHGRRPPRVRGFNHRQWQALQRALLWTRGERRIDVTELLHALGRSDAANVRVAPDDVLAPEEGGFGWLRVSAWVIGVLAAIAAVVFFLPQLTQRDEPGAVEAASVTAPAADSGQQPTSTLAAPESASDTGSQPTTSAPASEAPNTPPQTKAAEPATDAERPGAATSGRGAVIEFDKDTYVATESDGSVKLRVSRGGSTRGRIGFTWSLRGNSAEAGADFAAIGPGSEEIPAGAREVSIMIPLVSDSLVENTELFLVELRADDRVSLGERSHAAVIIVDDD